MSTLFDSSAPKKATNLSVNSDLLKQCRAMDINLSATLEQALQQKLAAVSAEKWGIENKNAIRAYNEFVEEQGCFGEEYREFCCISLMYTQIRARRPEVPTLIS